MKRTIHKMFPIWQFDKEEIWLNEMSAKGLQLCDVGFCRYVFEDGMPGEYTYRLELLDKMPSNIESTRYIHFIEDTGAEHVASLLRWVYFRKKVSEGGFDLFSDSSSRIKHLNRILLLLTLISVINLFNGLNQLSQWLTEKYTATLCLAGLCLILGLLCGYGVFKVLRLRFRLKKEQLLHE